MPMAVTLVSLSPRITLIRWPAAVFFIIQKNFAQKICASSTLFKFANAGVSTTAVSRLLLQQQSSLLQSLQTTETCDIICLTSQ
jgi:hypothetical protein